MYIFIYLHTLFHSLRDYPSEFANLIYVNVNVNVKRLLQFSQATAGGIANRGGSG